MCLLGLYCSGWIKRGPVGVIVSTMQDSFLTASSVIEDLNESELKPGREVVENILKQKGIVQIHWARKKYIPPNEKLCFHLVNIFLKNYTNSYI